MNSHLTIEEMWQKASEVRKAAKALQQKLQTVTNPVERRQLARQMNELFNQASALRNETKHRRWFEESIEREFLSMNSDMEDN